jgi:hypothetical protein
MLLKNALISDRFIRYIVMFAASVHRNFGNSDVISIIVRIRIIIILFDRSAIPF